MTDPAPQRIAVKFFADPEPGPGLDLEPFIGMFHGFIQDQALDGLLIDVADYAHVPEGPGILLVGHDVDYGVDRGAGRTGLLVTRKRHGKAPLAEVLHDTLRKALVAIQAIHASGVSPLRFRTDALELVAFDRLAAPNTPEGAAALRAGAAPVFAELYGDAKVEIEAGHADPRAPLGLRITAQEAPDAGALLERLGGAPEQAAAPQSGFDISVEELKRLRDAGEGFELIDVREPHEYEICNLGGTLIPLSKLPDKLAELDPGTHFVVHCKVGGRGAAAVELMRGAGFENAWNVEGGILAWIDRIDPSLTRY